MRTPRSVGTDTSPGSTRARLMNGGNTQHPSQGSSATHIGDAQLHPFLLGGCTKPDTADGMRGAINTYLPLRIKTMSDDPPSVYSAKAIPGDQIGRRIIRTGAGDKSRA
jgi:hypothetical protein